MRWPSVHPGFTHASASGRLTEEVEDQTAKPDCGYVRQREYVSAHRTEAPVARDDALDRTALALPGARGGGIGVFFSLDLEGSS